MIPEMVRAPGVNISFEYLGNVMSRRKKESPVTGAMLVISEIQ
jgi:hypothetical protein